MSRDDPNEAGWVARCQRVRERIGVPIRRSRRIRPHEYL